MGSHPGALLLDRSGGRLFVATIGPLITPRRVVEAIIANEADAGPLDAWWHALLRRHEPALAKRLRIVATTLPTPIPLVVCAASIDAERRQRLAAAFARVGSAAALARVRDALLLARFDPPATANYQALSDDARATDALGYHRLR